MRLMKTYETGMAGHTCVVGMMRKDDVNVVELEALQGLLSALDDAEKVEFSIGMDTPHGSKPTVCARDPCRWAPCGCPRISSS